MSIYTNINFSIQDTNVHYIDEDWQLKSHCLAVTENKEAHTAVNYRQNVDDVLDEFAIKSKVVKTVTDNENKMKASFNKEERTGCMAHIIHSSVSEGYKKATVVKEIIEKIEKLLPSIITVMLSNIMWRKNKRRGAFQ